MNLHGDTHFRRNRPTRRRVKRRRPMENTIAHDWSAEAEHRRQRTPRESGKVQ